MLSAAAPLCHAGGAPGEAAASIQAGEPGDHAGHDPASCPLCLATFQGRSAALHGGEGQLETILAETRREPSTPPLRASLLRVRELGARAPPAPRVR